MKSIPVLFLSSLLIFFAGCQSEEQSSSQITGEKIEVEGSWARPGSEGGTSAAYFLITNFEQEADTLLSVQSDIAQMVEVHESYEDGDMVGMREVGQVQIPAESTVRFDQGGLHVMLMQLNQSLSDGDSFELTLNFANHSNIILNIPVRR